MELALVGEEVEGWKSLGLEPPRQRGGAEPELPDESGKLLGAADASATQLTNVLSVIALHLDENERRWEQQQRENAQVRRQLDEAESRNGDLRRELQQANEQVALLSGRLVNVESTCKALAGDVQAMGASVRA